MKKVADGPASYIFEFDTSKFKHAELHADGRLSLEMWVSPQPMFAESFVDGLRGEVGEDADFLLDRATFEMNRQIAVRLLVK